MTKHTYSLDISNAKGNQSSTSSLKRKSNVRKKNTLKGNEQTRLDVLACVMIVHTPRTHQYIDAASADLHVIILQLHRWNKSYDGGF